MTSGQVGLAITAAVLVFWAVGAYNRLMTLRNAMRSAFAQLEAQLRLRHDLVPRLAEAAQRDTATGPADTDADPEVGGEPDALRAAIGARHQAHAALNLARAHPGAPGPTVSLAMAEQVLEDACRRLHQAIDATPGLRSEPAVQSARDELLGVEGRLGFARQLYNDAVAAYNSAVQQFPTRVLSSLFGFREAAPLPAPADGAPRPA